MKIRGLFIALIAVVIVGCGGSSSSSDNNPAPSDSLLTGKFIDSAVSNLFYQTETQSGYTNSSGEYQYKSGETVMFKIGDIELGSSPAISIITPKTLAEQKTSNVTDRETISTNIARILQTFDKDNNASNGIDLEELKDVNTALSNIDFTSEATVQSIVTNVETHTNKTYTIVDATTAKAHLDASIEAIEGSAPANNPPVANAGADKTITEGEQVSFDASGSSDSDGSIVSYSWESNNVVLAPTKIFIIAEDFFSEGTNTVTLTVTDDDGATATDTVTIVVNPDLTISGNYTRNNVKKVVTDSTTGLIWQDNSDTASVQKQWITTENFNNAIYSNTSGDTATTYCEDLTLGGYSNWRLPTKEELESIVDSGNSFPSINPIFQNTAPEYYWSSTSYKTANSNATWIVDFDYGFSNVNYKEKTSYIRCVRTTQ